MLEVEKISSDSTYPILIQELVALDEESMKQIAYYSKPESWNKVLNTRNRSLLIMKDSDSLVGFCDITMDYEDPACYFAYWVAPDKRGQGYGKQVIETMFSWIKTSSRSRVVLGSVSESNIASKKVLESCNFMEDYRKDGFIYYTRVS